MSKKRGAAAVRDLVGTILDAVDAASGSGPVDDNVIVVNTGRPPRVEIKMRNDLDISSMPPDSEVLDRWQPGVRSAVKAADVNVIEIFDVIGYDWWTGGGITTESVSEQLKAFKGEAVEVQINSPGGDMFEGIGIYNLLQQYPGKITVKVLALAASAASTIAMAGDEIQIGQGAFIMIHNCWVMAMGNRNDMQEVAAYLEPFDKALCDIYVARTGEDAKQIATWMDDEKWLSSQEAIDLGFADKTIDAKDLSKDDNAAAKALAVNPVRKMESLLCKQGYSRKNARALIKSLKGGTQDAATDPEAGTQDAADNTTQDAGEDWSKAAEALINQLKK